MTNETTVNTPTEIEQTTATPDSTTPDKETTEVKNPAALLAVNKEIRLRLAAAKADLASAQEASKTAQARALEYKARWYKSAIEDPFLVELQDLCAGPAWLGKIFFMEKGFLKMLPDAEGVERPAWFDHEGNPATPEDMKDGLWQFFNRVIEKMGGAKNPAALEVLRVQRASRMSGGGSTASYGNHSLALKPKAPDSTPTTSTYGLR